ncbi:chromate transporter [Rhizobium rosettiformans]|uniref:chromate transporter n=1 Tax=Rhizobium rosettiformans TaxID=1368430 RepID=UPI00285445BE|nr:chromate transporter [Rhizobium rosettiformans]MDR7031062.1 chromate transporter [Rhizobium rosettiformans]MDR7066966.1 chromate transporter [Rhizobium rosettiformans]
MTAHADESASDVSLTTLFLACLKLGLLSFGGGLSGWVYQDFVVRRRWISDEDFASSFAMGQMLPGGNVANLVVCLGEQLRGALGAATAVFGLLVGPFFSVILVAILIDSITQAEMLDIALTGAAAAAIGFLINLSWRGVLRESNSPAMLGIIAAVVLGVGILKLPLLLVTLCVAPASIAIAWRRGARDA